MKDIGRSFMNQTRYQHLEPSDQMLGLPAPPPELPCDDDAERVPLPPPAGLRVRGLDLGDAISGRRSVRRFSSEPISVEELSYLLWCTQGVKRVIQGSVTMRTVPSAGARHALETYLLINRVAGLEPGLYRFLALSHELVVVDRSQGVADDVADGCLGQGFVKHCAVTFIWAAETYRMTWRYSDRGYRYLFLDAGHVCQNLYLSAQSMGCGVCAVAAFSDDDMNRLLGLDGESRFVIYIAAAGKT
jgi:SagB-type dehydrogenase family enzyme